jgi:hypothetical protein
MDSNKGIKLPYIVQFKTEYITFLWCAFLFYIFKRLSVFICKQHYLMISCHKSPSINAKWKEVYMAMLIGAGPTGITAINVKSIALRTVTVFFSSCEM